MWNMYMIPPIAVITGILHNSFLTFSVYFI